MNCSNYGKISLLSNTEKLLEKIRYSRFYTFLDKRKLVYFCQFWFRHEQSLTHELINLIKKLELDGDNHGGNIIVDIQKAFDTVDNNIILKKARTLQK